MKLAAISAARLKGATVTFPVSGGMLDLAAKTASVELDVEPSPPFPGKQGRVGVFEVNMAAAWVSSDPTARTISVSGAPLTLEPQTANTLDEAFAEGKETFKAGEVPGAVSFVAQGQQGMRGAQPHPRRRPPTRQPGR